MDGGWVTVGPARYLREVGGRHLTADRGCMGCKSVLPVVSFLANTGFIVFLVCSTSSTSFNPARIVRRLSFYTVRITNLL